MNQRSSGGNDVIVIEASAGGVEALRSIAAGLPADLRAAVLVVLHIWPEGKSMLPRILSASGPLAAQHAVDGEKFLPYAPTRGPRENRHRPAVDPLFRSAALTFGPRVTGVILTGTLDDGAAGLRAVKDRRGIAILQDPLEAAYSGMPQSGLAAAKVDYVLKLADIPGTLAQLARHGRPARPDPTAPGSQMAEENAASEALMSALDDDVNHRRSIRV